MDTTTAASTETPAAGSPDTTAPAGESWDLNGVTISEAPAAGEATDPAKPAEAEPAKTEEKPKNAAEKALGARFADAHRLQKEAKAKIAEAERIKTETAARETQLAEREAKVTTWESAVKAKDWATIWQTLEAAGLTFDGAIDHFASQGKELSPAEKTAQDAAARVAKLEAERAAELKEREERTAREKTEAEARAKQEHEAALNQHVALATSIANDAGYPKLPREAAQRAVEMVHESWNEMGRPPVGPDEYAEAIRVAIGRVEEEFGARGLLLMKAPKVATPASTDANAASGSEPAKTPPPQPGANTAPPRTITSSTVSGTPLRTTVNVPADRDSALDFAFKEHGL